MGVVHVGVVHPEPVPDGAHVAGGVDGVGPLVQRLLVRLLRAGGGGLSISVTRVRADGDGVVLDLGLLDRRADYVQAAEVSFMCAQTEFTVGEQLPKSFTPGSQSCGTTIPQSSSQAPS